ncbi:hypothetical protein DFS34DRAFT_310497 [Phlyctochytrium arcticum]|nr:hypothetical protein DFS34DRAFT_310497 [Phlyctochytrium arcticum]
MEESSSMESGQPPASHSRRASLRTNNGERYSRTTAPPSGQRIVYGLDNNLGMSAWDFINFGSGPIPMNSTSPSVTKSAPSSLFRRITSGLVFPEEVANVDEGKRRRRCRCSWRAVKNWMTLYFDDPEKERHYRSWWWSKYHRRWLICCMILLAGNILLFSQYVLLAVLSERNGCFGLSQGWCPPNSPVSTEYKWRSDVMIFLIGSFLPSVALLAMHYRLPTSYLSQRCHYIFLICCSLNFTGSFIIRPRVVDPDGDMWLYGLFNLISIAWLPCIASLPSHMTCILGIINFIAYVSAFASSMDDRHSLSYHCMVVYLACGVCTATGITRVLENIERRMFVMSYGLRTVNEGLKIRLKGLEKQYSFQAADMDSPLEKAIGAIKSVMANPSLDAATFKHLGYVLSWLSDTDKLLIPDFGGQLSGAVVGVDQEHEVKTWLLNLLPGQSRASRSKRQIQRPGNSGTTSAQDSFAEGQSRVDILSLLPARYDSPTFAADPATLEEGLSSLSGPEYVEPSPSTSSLPSSAAPNSPFLAGFGTNSSGFVGKDYLRNPLFDSNAPLLPPLNQAGVVKERELRRRGSVDRSDQSKDNPRVKALLATMDQWNWSIFELESVTAGRPLAIMGMHVMSVSGISDRLKIPADKMQRFMRRIELVYRPEVPCTF